jgi:hypothetical protein
VILSYLLSFSIDCMISLKWSSYFYSLASNPVYNNAFIRRPANLTSPSKPYPNALKCPRAISFRTSSFFPISLSSFLR